jgi:hypothetical protein
MKLTQRTAALVGTVLVALSGCGGGHSSPAKPTVSLKANATTIYYGAPLELTWSSANATACTSANNQTQDWAGSQALSGTKSFDSLPGTTTFSLTCTGAGGTTAASITITLVQAPMPTLTFNAADAVVAKAGMDMLTWTSSNATSCAAMDGWSGAQGVSGSSQVGPITTQTTYALVCTGLGGSVSASVTVGVSATLPPAGPIGTLAAGVVIVNGPGPPNSALSGDVLSQSATSVIFNCCVSVSAGQIFTVGGFAYKATDEAYGPPYSVLNPDSSQVITVEAPSLEAVFDQLDITGTYTLDASQMVAQSAAARAQSAKSMRLSLESRPAAAAAVSIPLSLNQDSVTVSGTGTVTLQATVNIHYSKSAGFTNSSIVIDTSAQAGSSVSASTVAPLLSAQAGHFRIPIPLAVVDAQSNLIAASAAFIDVPVFVVALPSVSYGIGFDTTFQGSAITTVVIASDGGLSTSVQPGTTADSFAFSGATASPDPTTPVSSILGDSLFTGIDLSASLQLLNLVNLATVDTKIGDRYNGQLTTLAVTADPAYCGGSTGDIEQQAAAIRELLSNVDTPLPAPVIGMLGASGPQPIGSYCGVQPIVAAAPGESAVVFSPLTVAVSVVAVPGGASAAPTGVVQVGLDGATCQAVIDSTGSGSCTLTPSIVGTRSLTYQYQGDANFPAGSAVSQSLNVALAQDLLSLAESPNPASTASGLNFNFSISPEPVNAAAPLPTGTVTVYSENGNQTSCTATLDNTAAGVCTIAAPPFGYTTIQAVYSGDANYAAHNLSGTIRVADNTGQLDVYVIKLQLGGVPTAFSVGNTASVTVVPDPGCCFAPESTPPTLNLVWTSSNPAVATVVAGTVTAVAPGTATITATDTTSQATGSLVVTVTDPAP